jgi:hypothetical protein
LSEASGFQIGVSFGRRTERDARFLQRWQLTVVWSALNDEPPLTAFAGIWHQSKPLPGLT